MHRLLNRPREHASPPRQINPQLPLLSLVALFLVLGIIYGTVIPLFENPDESSHLQVIRYLGRERRLYPPVVPAQRAATGPDMAETLRPHSPPRYYTPPLYHILAAVIVGGIEMDDLDARLIPNPAWDAGWAPQRNADPWNKNMFVHLPGETWAASPTMRAALILRFISLALSCVTLVCTYRIARFIHPETRFAFGATVCVALNPQFIALSASVTNDPLLIAIVSLATLLAMRLMQTAAHWTRWAALGALVGLGLLTKQSALLLLPVGGLAILGQMPTLKTAPHPFGLPAKGESTIQVPKIAADGLAFGGAALLVGGSWYIHNALRYHDPLGMRSHFASQMPLQAFGWAEIWAIFETYWGSFGWTLLSLPDWVYVSLAGVVALAAMGIARAVWRGQLRCLPPMERRHLRLLAILWLMNGLTLIRWSIATGAPYGRLLFPSSVSIGVLLAWGLAQWRTLPGARFGTATLVCLITLLAALTPWTVLQPAFATPRYASTLPSQATLVDVTFDDSITMLAYTAPDRDLQPGHALPVNLYWQAASASSPMYSTWMQFSPQDPTQRVAESVRWLGGTLYPSNLWRTGDIIREKHTLQLPADMPAPALYWVRLGLADEIGARITGDGGADMISLGPWRVRTQRAPAAPAYQVNASLGEHITLRGYDVAFTDPLVVTLTWAATGVPPQDYTVFVHLVSADGALLAQHDGPPNQGRYPTRWWLRGDVIVDAHPLPLAAPLPEAAYLRVGMYDPVTLLRLPVHDATGVRLPDDFVSLVVSR